MNQPEIVWCRAGLKIVGGLANMGRRSNPHPHRRGQEPRAEARSAHEPAAEIDRGAEGRSTAAAGGGCHPCRTRTQLRRGEKHDLKTHPILTRTHGDRSYDAQSVVPLSHLQGRTSCFPSLRRKIEVIATGQIQRSMGLPTALSRSRRPSRER